MEEVKLSLFTDVMILYLKITGTPQNRIAPVNTFNKVADTKSTQKDTLQEMKPAHVSIHK